MRIKEFNLSTLYVYNLLMPYRFIRWKWSAIVVVFLTTFLSLFWLRGPRRSSSILDRAPELQKTAVIASGGGMGCGIGVIRVVTPDGERRLYGGLDPIHVFGRSVKLSDLHLLIESRVESVRIGQGPLIGDFAVLLDISLGLIAGACEAESFAPVLRLMNDPDRAIRQSALMTLIALADKYPEFSETLATLDVQPREWMDAAQRAAQVTRNSRTGDLRSMLQTRPATSPNPS